MMNFISSYYVYLQEQIDRKCSIYRWNIKSIQYFFAACQKETLYIWRKEDNSLTCSSFESLCLFL
jgi:hypothetical protein